MKKIGIFLLFCSVLTQDLNGYNADLVTPCSETLAYCPPNCGTDMGRTFMFTRPAYRNIVAQFSLWHDTIFPGCSKKKYGLQAVGSFQDSLANSKIRRYFLFDRLDNLSVKGDTAAPTPYARDVRAEWLGLPATFAGGMTVNPKQRQWSVLLEGYTSLEPWFPDSEFLRTFWIGIGLPIQGVKNDIRLTQTLVVGTTSDFPQDLVQALANPAWNFAKFGPAKTIIGAAELNFKCGVNFLDRDAFQIGMYSSFIFPLRGAANPEYVFSPFLGNNRHFGYSTGVLFQLPLNCNTQDYLCALFVEMEGIYFFRDIQQRTFDLKGKPWSRYLLFNAQDGRRNIPGVNVLTRSARVRAYCMGDFAFGLRFQEGGWEMEVAYSPWLRSRESVRLRKCFSSEVGIAGVGSVAGTGIPATASQSTIQAQAADDLDLKGNLTFVAIRDIDIETNSAAARGAINHRAVADIGYALASCSTDARIGVGAFVEIPQYNSDFTRWGAWGKMVVTF